MTKPRKPNPRAMTHAETAQLLSKLLGRRIGPGEISADVEAGAPTNDDGTLDLALYAAWLAKRERESV